MVYTYEFNLYLSTNSSTTKIFQGIHELDGPAFPLSIAVLKRFSAAVSIVSSDWLISPQ